MKKLRIGMVDLDTSHPSSWLPVIRSLGHDVVGVYDGGTIYPAGYAEQFASEHRIAKSYDSLDEMADAVDLAIVHSCNWDLHIDRARPFAAAGKAVLIDKPMAGNVRDLQQIVEWAGQGIRITGGSALRFCYEVQEWSASQNAREDWVYAYAGCAVDEFNYGIHAYSMLLGLAGGGISGVRHLGENGQRQVELEWSDGRRGLLAVGPNPSYLPFYATITTRKGVSHLIVDNNRLYQALLENVLPFFAGEAEAPMPVETLIEAEMAAIAANLSRERGGERVLLRDIPHDYDGYDGAAFAEHYRRLKFGS